MASYWPVFLPGPSVLNWRTLPKTGTAGGPGIWLMSARTLDDGLLTMTKTTTVARRQKNVEMTTVINISSALQENKKKCRWADCLQIVCCTSLLRQFLHMLHRPPKTRQNIDQFWNPQTWRHAQSRWTIDFFLMEADSTNRLSVGYIELDKSLIVFVHRHIRKVYIVCSVNIYLTQLFNKYEEPCSRL